MNLYTLDIHTHDVHTHRIYELDITPDAILVYLYLEAYEWPRRVAETAQDLGILIYEVYTAYTELVDHGLARDLGPCDTSNVSDSICALV